MGAGPILRERAVTGAALLPVMAVTAPLLAAAHELNCLTGFTAQAVFNSVTAPGVFQAH